MTDFNIAKNICRFRHKRKITQEQLAAFIGVTKASVSKWETGQSMPDISLLPQLATFFDVTIDELLGHNPQLSSEQIRKLYQEFADDFACHPFDETIAKTQSYVKRYYCCYPFLVKVCILWLNHYTLADGKENQTKLLNSADQLCEHIKQNCRSLEICSDVLILQAMIHLILGRPLDVIEELEEVLKPHKLSRQSDTVLTQAYLAAGKTEMADIYTQAAMYLHLISFLGNAAMYLSVHIHSLSVCETTISRIEQLCSIYEIAKLNPNSYAAFEYQAAVCYAVHGEKEKAVCCIQNYVLGLTELFSSQDQLLLHGDAYFDRLHQWYDKTDTGPSAPRNRSIVLEDAKKSLESQPAFDILKGEPAFEKLKDKICRLK